MKKERTWSSMNLRQNGMIIALIVIILGLALRPAVRCSVR